MEKRYSQRISEKRWRVYKDTIHRLYVTENRPLTAAGGVKDIMTTRHNFSATKAQYETKLKRWGFHKYSPANNPLPLSRDLVFRPPSPHRSTPRPDQLRRAILLWPSASATITKTKPRNSDSDLGRFFLKDNTSSSTTDLSTINPFDSICQTFLNVDYIASTTGSLNYHSSMSTHSQDSSWEIGAEEFQNWNQLGLVPLKSTDAGLFPGEASLSRYSFLLDFAYYLMPTISQIACIVTPSSHLAILKTSTVMRSAIDSVLEKKSSSSTSQLLKRQTIDFQIIYTVFHRLVNDKRIGFKLAQPHTEFDWLFKVSVEHILSLGPQFIGNAIDSVSSLYKPALSQGLFTAALAMGNCPVLKAILDRVDLANQPLYISTEYSPEYPLEHAVKSKDLLAVQILLLHGADPNRHFHYPIATGWTYFTTDLHEDHDTQMLALLLEHGLRKGDMHLKDMLMYWTKEEFELLVTHDLDQALRLFLEHRLLPSLLLRSDWDDSLSKILKAFLQRGKLDRAISTDVWESILTECLCVAVQLKNRSEAHLLLEMGAIPDASCLVSSVHSDDLTLLERFLDMGADANALSNSKRTYASDLHYIFTALSESIVNESQRAFEVFKDRGFIWELAENRQSFVPALMAACDIGNVALVGTLLATRKFSLAHISSSIESPLLDLSLTLERAIREGHESICNQLLAAEILPTASCLEAAYQTRQTALLVTMADLVPPTARIFCGVMGNGDKGDLEDMFRNGLPVDDVHKLNPNDAETEELSKIFGMSTDWKTSLLAAAVLGQSAVAVEVLLAHGAQVNTLQRPKSKYPYAGNMLLTALAACVIRRNFPLLTELLYRGADPFDNGAIYVATVYGLEDIIKLLLLRFKHRYPHGVKTFGSNALCWAIASGSLPLVQLLVKDVDISGIVDRWIPSSKKIQSTTWPSQIRRTGLLQRPKILPIRMDYVPLPALPPPPPPPPYWFRREHDNVPLHFTSPLGEAIRIHCCESARPQLLHVLLPRITDLNAVVVNHNMDGWLTGLLYAISLCSLDTVRLLAENGADIHFPARHKIKRTALQFATQLGNKEIVKYLLGKGVSPNEPPASYQGATSLQLAAIKGYVGLASILMDAGAHVNAEPGLLYGRTAFEGATEHGRIEMMVFLVQNGADLLSNNRQQHRQAVLFAKENGQHASIQLADDLLDKVLEGQGRGGPGEEGNRASPAASEFGADQSVWSVSEFVNDVDFDVGF
ncbi:hypothetical protein HBI13_060490 [Parastagonospora nodorum]|nr:hypothetical protein HBI10_091470 [Parastagonospora nodorum]KAH4027528.1 hypothetical protein HBI13_060490 [Parastagonospora nodorum]KAH6304673.1 hypothetical protein HBI39_108300 [Parastagonospora nodorum]